MWINVMDEPYGAKGNGSDDDPEAIQAALDAASGEEPSPDLRNAVYFPPGTYRITGTLELTKCQGVRLIGVGNTGGTPVYLGGYAFPNKRYSGAILFWDGVPGGELLRVYGSYFGSLESLTFVGATPQRYKFSTTTTDSDPGDGYLRFDDSAFASVTKIFADDKNAFGVIIRDWLDRLDDGSAGRITIQNVTAAGAFRVLDVTGAVTDATGYRRVVVAPVQANGTFAEDDGVIVSFISTGGSPQPYEFSDSTSTNPPNGVLRFDHGTFASITKIYADDLSANGLMSERGWTPSTIRPTCASPLCGRTTTRSCASSRLTASSTQRDTGRSTSRRSTPWECSPTARRSC